MSNDGLITALENLKDSVDSLTAIHHDIFKTNSSHDDIVELKGRMSDLIKSNKELKQAIDGLASELRNK